MDKLNEFRCLFRDIINLMSQKKNLINYIFMGFDLNENPY